MGNIFIEIESRNLLNDIIESNPALQIKDKNLIKISKFLNSNPESAQLLFSYLNKLQSESDKNINNRNAVIRIMSRNLENLNSKYQKDNYFFNFVNDLRGKSFQFNLETPGGLFVKARNSLKVKDAIKMFYDSNKETKYMRGIIELIKKTQKKEFDIVDISEADILKKLASKYYNIQQNNNITSKDKKKKTMKQHR